MKHLALLLALASPLSARQLSFARTDLSVGGTPTWVEAADVDLDGAADVVSAVGDTGAVQVFLAQSPGVFGPSNSLRVLDGPNALALGDLDGDGVPDLVVGHADAARSLVLHGAGDGSFSTIVALDSDLLTQTHLLADFDLDGALDIAIANFQSSAVSVHFGDGTGAFPQSVDLPASSGPRHLVAVDFEGDGDPDLAASRAESSLVFSPIVFENLGARAFAPGPLTHMSGVPVWIAAGDLTGDGLPDLACPASDVLISHLETFEGAGDGSFSEVGLVAEARMAELANLNGDGIPDFLYRYSYFGDIRARLGAGDGQAFGTPVQTGTPTRSVRTAVHDLSGDGLDDFVTANTDPPGLSVMINTSCGAPRIDSVTPASVPNLAVGAPTIVQLEGACLAGTTSIQVGGVALEAAAVERVSPELIAFEMPLVPTLGPVAIELSGGDGFVDTEVEIVVTAPAVDLADADPGVLDPDEPAVVTLGGAPGDLSLLFAAPDMLPSSAPGVLEFGIGAGFTTLFYVDSSVLGPGGWRQHFFDLSNVAPGTHFYLQAAVLEVGETEPPLVATNIVSGTVGH